MRTVAAQEYGYANERKKGASRRQVFELAGVEFIDAYDGDPGVRLQVSSAEK